MNTGMEDGWEHIQSAGNTSSQHKALLEAMDTVNSKVILRYAGSHEFIVNVSLLVENMAVGDP